MMEPEFEFIDAEENITRIIERERVDGLEEMKTRMTGIEENVDGIMNNFDEMRTRLGYLNDITNKIDALIKHIGGKAEESKVIDRIEEELDRVENNVIVRIEDKLIGIEKEQKDIMISIIGIRSSINTQLQTEKAIFAKLELLEKEMKNNIIRINKMETFYESMLTQSMMNIKNYNNELLKEIKQMFMKGYRQPQIPTTATDLSYIQMFGL